MKYVLFIDHRRLFKEAIIGFEAAKKLGFNVVLISSNLPISLEPFVDKFIKLELRTPEYILSVIAGYDIAGVIPSTENSVEISALVANALGLPGMPIENVKYARDKSALREKIFHPSRVVVSEEDVRNFPLPAVIKPANSSGSIGIFVINSREDIENFLKNKIHIANPSYDVNLKKDKTTFIIEKYIYGTEVSVEGFVYCGKVIIIGITSKETTLEWKLEIEHIFPEKLSETIEKLIYTKTEELVLSLGFNNTCFHLEGKYNQNGFELIEVAARPGGDYIASRLISLASGYSFYEDLIRICTGLPPLGIKKSFRYSGIVFITADREGVLKGFKGLDIILSHPFTEHLSFELKIGDKIILPPKHFRKMFLLSVISTCPSYELLKEHLHFCRETLIPIYE